MAKVSSSAERARDHWRDHWTRVIEEQRESGLSQTAFCEERGISLRSFRRWKYQRLRKAGDRLAETSSASGFVPVQVIGDDDPEKSPVPSDRGAGVELVIREVRVRVGVGFHQETLRRVLETVGRSGC